jgi:hypothetical protein
MRYKQVIVIDETPCLQNDFRKLNITPYQMNLLIKLNKVVPCLNGEDLNDIYLKIGLFIKFRYLHKRRKLLLNAIESMCDDPYFKNIFARLRCIVDDEMMFKKFSYDYWYKNYYTEEESDNINGISGMGDDEADLNFYLDNDNIDIDEINEIGAKERIELYKNKDEEERLFKEKVEIGRKEQFERTKKEGQERYRELLCIKLKVEKELERYKEWEVLEVYNSDNQPLKFYSYNNYITAYPPP